MSHAATTQTPLDRAPRRSWLRAAFACTFLSVPVLFSAAAQDSPSKKESAAEDPADGIQWHDLESWGIEGRGWPDSAVASYYDRLPAKAEKIVRPPVWSLSRHSAGLSARFNTDASEIRIRYEVGSERLAMPHMPATGVSGADLYALDGDGVWKWVSASKPTEKTTEHHVAGLDPGMRSYTVYLPLYNSTVKMSIGVPAGAEFQPVAPREEKPIVFYGTSITHGACASRPGMTHPALLGRWLDRPVINLGFSGNGKMEPEVGALLAEIDAAAYVIDCLPNMNGGQVAERAAPLVRQLRISRPDTPIVLVEDRTYTNAWIMAERRERHRASRAALVKAYDELVASGVKNLHYLEGDALLGDDHEAATDGSHPNDLGFFRQAKAMEPVLREALGME